MTELLDDLRTAAAPPPPSGWTPGIRYSGAQPAEVVTPWLDHELPEGDYSEVIANMGVPLPPGKTLELIEARFNQAAWHRDAQDRRQKDTAYTAPAWIYRFRVVPISLRADADLETLAKAARKAARAKSPAVLAEGTTMVINLADFQVGKTDELGGTPELLERSERAFALVLQQVRKMKPAEIILADIGDSTEGFESAPNAARTNDLQQTEQIRVWRRIFWRWIDGLAGLGVPMQIVSVPSNHCRVRRGKDNVGPTNDDWGLEVLAQLQDMAGVNPERYGHLAFIAPRPFEHHVTLTLAGGKIQTFAHGHDANSPDRLPAWAKSQGRRDIGVSDIVTVGHFHHLRVVSYGDDQTLFICPTNDGGSSWFTPRSGDRSRPGVLTYVVDESGWRNLFVAWTA